MEEEWDAEGFEPAVGPTLVALSNQWEGEDEDDNVKESWEDEEEEKKDEEKKEGPPGGPVVAKSKNKRLAEKIAQKEKEHELEMEKKLAEEEEDDTTPEEKVAEKLRRQRMQEEADLRVALETFGINDKSGGSLDSFNPQTKEEFDEFSEALTTKISFYREKVEYVDFVTGLVKNIVLHMPSGDIRNLKGALENLYVEKSKFEKGDKAKKSTKGKGKAKLMMETDVTKQSYGYEYDEFDDFM